MSQFIEKLFEFMEITHLGLRLLLPSKKGRWFPPIPTAGEGGRAWALPCGCHFLTPPRCQSCLPGAFSRNLLFLGRRGGEKSTREGFASTATVSGGACSHQWGRLQPTAAARTVSFLMTVTLSTLGTWDRDPRGLCPPSIPPQERHHLPAAQPGIWGAETASYRSDPLLCE